MRALLEMSSKELATALGVGLLAFCVVAPMMWMLLKRLVSTSSPLQASTIDDRQYTSLVSTVVDAIKSRKE
jgi:hypothetical protein